MRLLIDFNDTKQMISFLNDLQLPEATQLYIADGLDKRSQRETFVLSSDLRPTGSIAVIRNEDGKFTKRIN